jgi:hypothetical protein
MFYKHVDGDCIIVAVDVDDLTMTGYSKHVISEFKDQLKLKFKVKDLGELHWLLGIGVQQDRAARTISFSQKAYIETILHHFNLQDANPVSMSLDPLYGAAAL